MIQKIKFVISQPSPDSQFVEEWLVTNGLGGFASGSISGAPTRKYHGYLVAAHPAPLGRVVMLNYIADSIILPDKREVMLSTLKHDKQDKITPLPLMEFRLEAGFPIWRYQVDDIIIEKSLFLVHQQNSLHMTYKVLSGSQPVEIKWRPYFHFRSNEDPVNAHVADDAYSLQVRDQYYEIHSPQFPVLRLFNFTQASFTYDANQLKDVFYELEFQRGYQCVGDLRSLGYYTKTLHVNESTTFIASTESWISVLALPPKEARQTEFLRRKRILKTAGPIANSHVAAKLTLAADQFIISPNTRFEDMVRLHAAGEEVRTVIAGYPWFTDWGRDTMISLEGLTLSTRRYQSAHSILRTFAHYVKDGLIPNMFPDGEKQGLYHTADATLWFFHAVDRYLEVTDDYDILELLLPKFSEIIDSHIKGTLFGIHVDEDGLLVQGQEGYQLTWMDAKVGDWVVTPRRGKAVEINALWYNALRLYEQWTNKHLEITHKCYESFNKRFWCEEKGCLYDVIDGPEGNDSSIRPNQLFAISLKYPVLHHSKWKPVLDIVEKDLLTPVGLRTLSPSDPNYKSAYDGNLHARDAAYHQGTVWPWLLGPFIDVWLKIYPDDVKGASSFLTGLEKHLEQNGMGMVAEIFDANEPYNPRGCFAQAWSVAEYLRCIVKIHQYREKEILGL